MEGEGKDLAEPADPLAQSQILLPPPRWKTSLSIPKAHPSHSWPIFHKNTPSEYGLGREEKEPTKTPKCVLIYCRCLDERWSEMSALKPPPLDN